MNCGRWCRKENGCRFSVIHTGSKIVGKNRFSERFNDSGDRLNISVVNKREVSWWSASVVDTTATVGDEEIVVVVGATVVVVEVSSEGASAMTPVVMVGW